MTIRLLVTGFEPFPGAPVNPTEHLIRHFEARPPLAGEAADCRFAVLPVDYARAIPALEKACEGFSPDIALHFGLSSRTSGFRLERLARNEIASSAPDNAGQSPPPAPISRQGDHRASTLPLERIAAALRGEGHAVEMSEDAGGYLCNYVFYHSVAGLCRGIGAGMSGFVHVGPVALPDQPDDAASMDFRKLVQGAETILKTCLDAALEE